MTQNLFKWKHFQTEIIILCVRWYLKYPLSYRMLVEIMQEWCYNKLLDTDVSFSIKY